MTIIGMDQLLRFAAALIFVLSLMGGLALVMRRINSGRSLIAPGKRRLRVIETMPLDGRRRLMLLQRDSRAHLVILGPNGETVIESGIELAQDETDGQLPHG